MRTRSLPSVRVLWVQCSLAAACGLVAAREGLIVVAALAIALAAGVVWSFARGLTASRPVVDAEARALALPRAAFLVGLLLIGQLTLRPLHGVTASDLFFLVALLFAVAGLVATRGIQVRSLPYGLVAGATLFAVGASASSFSSHTVGTSIGVVGRFLYLTLLWLWLATVVLRRRGDIRLGTALWVASLGLSGAAAIVQLFFGDVIPGTHLAFGRMTGTTQHVSDLGGSTAVALPAAIGLALATFSGRGVKLVGFAGSLLVTIGLLLSGSIGGMMAAVVGIALMAIVAKRLPSIATLIALLVAAALIGWHFQIAERATRGTLSERISSVTASTGTFAARVDVYKAAWSHIADNPLVGVGLGFDPRAAGAALPDLIHDAYLSVWYQGGVLALAGLLIMSLSALAAALRAASDARTSDERLLAASLAGSTAAYLVFGLGEPTLYVRYGWVPVALALALGAQQRRAAELP